MQLPVRQPVAGRRSRVTRASTVLTGTRILAAALVLAASGAFQWLTVAREFALDPAKVTVGGLAHTSQEQVVAALGLEGGVRPNVFRIRTDDLEHALSTLPAVLRADVSVVLPDRLEVAVEERQPIFVLRRGDGDTAFLVDLEGILFAPAGVAEPANVPVIADARPGSPSAVGERIAPLELEVMRRLGAVTPEVIGSAATRLVLTAEETDGWVLETPGGWRAIFGHYTARSRPVELIDEQVQCLRALLQGQEDAVDAVFLAPTAERCGTYLPGATPRPTRPPRPSPTP